MYDHTFSKLANHQIRRHTWSGLSAWWLHMVTLIFLRGLRGYVRVNILTLCGLIGVIMSSFLKFQVVSLALRSVIPEVANFCTVIDTLVDQDPCHMILKEVHCVHWDDSCLHSFSELVSWVTFMVVQFCKCQVVCSVTSTFNDFPDQNLNSLTKKSVSPDFCDCGRYIFRYLESVWVSSWSASHNDWCTGTL